MDCRYGKGAYGGLWTENIVQALSRDLLAAAMQRLEAAGYHIVLHVHDEIVVEVRTDFGSVEEFQRTGPKACRSLPRFGQARGFASSPSRNPSPIERAPATLQPGSTRPRGIKITVRMRATRTRTAAPRTPTMLAIVVATTIMRPANNHGAPAPPATFIATPPVRLTFALFAPGASNFRSTIGRTAAGSGVNRRAQKSPTDCRS